MTPASVKRNLPPGARTRATSTKIAARSRRCKMTSIETTAWKCALEKGRSSFKSACCRVICWESPKEAARSRAAVMAFALTSSPTAWHFVCAEMIQKATRRREFEFGDVGEEFFGGHPGVLAYVLTIGFRAELAHERGIEVFVEFVVGSGHGLKILCDIENDCRTERRVTHLEQTTRMGHRAVASDQYAAPSRRSLSVPWKGKRYTPVVTGSRRNRLRLQGIELVRGACDGGSEARGVETPPSPYFS